MSTGIEHATAPPKSLVIHIPLQANTLRSAPGRHPEAVPASQREQRFWMYLSSEEIPSRAGGQRGLLAVRPHYDESEVSVWRVLSPDTVVIRLTGMCTRDYR